MDDVKQNSTTEVSETWSTLYVKRPFRSLVVFSYLGEVRGSVIVENDVELDELLTKLPRREQDEL